MSHTQDTAGGRGASRIVRWAGAIVFLVGTIDVSAGEHGSGRLGPCRILALGTSPTEFNAGDEIKVGVTYRCETAVGALEVWIVHQRAAGDEGAPSAWRDTTTLRRGQHTFYSLSIPAGRGGCYALSLARAGETSARFCPRPVRWSAPTVRFP